MEIPPYTATSKVIPTTFISTKIYEKSYEKAPMIHEQPESKVVQDSNRDLVTDNRVNNSSSLFESAPDENTSIFQVTSPTEEDMPSATFDYLYEFSETRKVLEEFFKCPENDQIKELGKFSDLNESDDSLVSLSQYLM